jgi:hypothetical protein
MRNDDSDSGIRTKGDGGNRSEIDDSRGRRDRGESEKCASASECE